MAQIMSKFHLAFGVAEPPQGDDLYASPAGVPFVRTRRRGLCSMSGRYPYGIDNPPTLRRSSFPQRASRPAGGPIPKHTWGCAPKTP